MIIVICWFSWGGGGNPVHSWRRALIYCPAARCGEVICIYQCDAFSPHSAATLIFEDTVITFTRSSWRFNRNCQSRNKTYRSVHQRTTLAAARLHHINHPASFWKWKSSWVRASLWLLLCYYICVPLWEGTDTNLWQDWSDTRLGGMKWGGVWRRVKACRGVRNRKSGVVKISDFPLRGNQNQSRQGFTVARHCCHFSVFQVCLSRVAGAYR